MPRVGFEPTIPVFERPKTVHALDGAATVIGMKLESLNENLTQHVLQMITKFIPHVIT
jgi:hypothetical protein